MLVYRIEHYKHRYHQKLNIRYAYKVNKRTNIAAHTIACEGNTGIKARV
jgi:hypothetical protein